MRDRGSGHWEGNRLMLQAVTGVCSGGLFFDLSRTFKIQSLITIVFSILLETFTVMVLCVKNGLCKNNP